MPLGDQHRHDYAIVFARRWRRVRLNSADDTTQRWNQRSIFPGARRNSHATSTIKPPPSSMPSTGEMTMNSGLRDAGLMTKPALAKARADQAADQRVRRAGRQAVPPGD
jgi:hypothetical protein